MLETVAQANLEPSSGLFQVDRHRAVNQQHGEEDGTLGGVCRF